MPQFTLPEDTSRETKPEPERVKTCKAFSYDPQNSVSTSDHSNSSEKRGLTSEE